MKTGKAGSPYLNRLLFSVNRRDGNSLRQVGEDLTEMRKFLAPSYLMRREENGPFFRTGDPDKVIVRPVDEKALASCEAILLLGSNDLSAPAHAADLFYKIDGGDSGVVIVASGKGGHATVPSGVFQPVTEADKFKEVLMHEGIPGENIITESMSENTGQNIINSHMKLSALPLFPTKFAIVQSPAAQLRANLVFERKWPKSWDYYLSLPPLPPPIHEMSIYELGFHLAYALREAATTIYYSYSPAIDFQTRRLIPEQVAAIILKYRALFNDEFSESLSPGNIIDDAEELAQGFRRIFVEIEKRIF